MVTREQIKANCKEILDYWNGKNIIMHDQTVIELEIAVRSALTKYGKGITKQCIDRYATAFHDADYLQCEYAWSLPNFLRTHNALPQYLDDGEKWVNYCRFKDGYSNKGNEVDEYRRVLAYLRSLPYREYLQTEHWEHFKQEALIFYGYKCQTCGAVKKIKIHHKTYKNRGRETFNDVMVLCDKCHREAHGITVSKGMQKSLAWQSHG